MSTQSPTPPTPAPTLTDVADDVSALEASFKADYTNLSAATKNLITTALAAAKAEGAMFFGALHTAVATVKK